MEKQIQSIQRAVAIMNCFSALKPKLTLSEISQQLQLNINTVRGIVNTLLIQGLLEHDKENNTYSLGLYFILKSNLIYETNQINSYVEFATEYMEIISNRYAIFCSLQLVNQSNIFMIKSTQPEDVHYRILADLYTPLSYHSTSSGKLYLQYLTPEKLKKELDRMEFIPYTPNTICNRKKLLKEIEDQKIRKYSLELDETGMGISSIAAPILLDNNYLFGTLSTTAPTQVLRLEMEHISDDLIKAAEKISQKIMEMKDSYSNPSL